LKILLNIKDYKIIHNQNKRVINIQTLVTKTNPEALEWLISSHGPMQASTAT